MMETSRRWESLFTHPPTEFNTKRSQKFLKMKDSRTTKATIPLKAMESLSALSSHHNRATLHHPLLSHAWDHTPLASPSLCQPPEELSRLTRLTQADLQSPGSNSLAPVKNAQCSQPTTQEVQQSVWKTSNENDPIWSWTHNTFLNTAMHLTSFNLLNIPPKQTISVIPVIQKR